MKFTRDDGKEGGTVLDIFTEADGTMTIRCLTRSGDVVDFKGVTLISHEVPETPGVETEELEVKMVEAEPQ